MASTTQPSEPEVSDRCGVPTAAEQRTRRARDLWASLIPSVLVATIFWLAGEVKIAVLVSIVGSILVGLIVTRRTNAFCPECRCKWYDYDAGGQNETQAGKLCPGCSLKLEERGELP